MRPAPVQCPSAKPRRTPDPLRDGRVLLWPGMAVRARTVVERAGLDDRAGRPPATGRPGGQDRRGRGATGPAASDVMVAAVVATWLRLPVSAASVASTLAALTGCGHPAAARAVARFVAAPAVLRALAAAAARDEPVPPPIGPAHGTPEVPGPA